MATNYEPTKPWARQNAGGKLSTIDLKKYTKFKMFGGTHAAWL